MDTMIRCLDDMSSEPWKNGGGLTRVLAQIKGQWRVSLANIDKPGPYSRFPAMQRLSMVIDGAGVVLRGTQEELHLAPFAPQAYAGDGVWEAELVDGPCVALNIMARAEQYRIEVCCLARGGVKPIARRAYAVVIARQAALRVQGAQGSDVSVLPGCFAVLAPDDQARTVQVVGQAAGQADDHPAMMALIEPVFEPA